MAGNIRVYGSQPVNNAIEKFRELCHILATLVLPQKYHYKII